MADSESSENRNLDDEYQRNQGELEDEHKKLKFVVPDSKVKLRACTHCRLLKTEDQQWKKSKSCDNCGDYNSFDEQTTDKFSGLITIITDTQSWVRRKKKLTRANLVMGSYAIKLNL